MSMKFTPVYAMGLLVDSTLLHAMTKVYVPEDPNEEDSHPFLEDLDLFEYKEFLDANGVECFVCSGFTGSADCPEEIKEHLGIEDGSTEDLFDDDAILVISLDHYPRLTRQAYPSVESIGDELKGKLKDVIPYLPKDYSFAEHIREIIGTVYG